MLQTETEIGEVVYEEGFDLPSLEGSVELLDGWVQVTSPDPDIPGRTLIPNNRVVRIELR